ncbi:amidohydrolase [Bacteroides heparinolyticus]|uniref:amidohydrolase n=1 Tax=Prevotella heparinolytica TaxID=28113 RepID=UPI000D032244|nr:amidohydrolase [Bacteroides heparinolyticus]AVM57184.1 amidohydrolase [Bacteroides heparinolyticus]
MRVSIIQTDIVWENKQENLCRIREKLETLRGATEIVVLPETFSTGFSMDTARLAEPITGETITTLRQWAKEFRFAITGSFIATGETSSGRATSYHNRSFFLTPEGNDYYYDKRHLFRMGSETKHFGAGDKRLIISYCGWNILLLVCYDLRFPVWSRNVKNEYDLVIYVANWPASRRKAWDTLLQARAIENMSYACGVNRIGSDNHGLPHNGGSAVFSPKGELLTNIPDNEERIATITLNLSDLREFRSKFPAWKDADSFQFI